MMNAMSSVVPHWYDNTYSIQTHGYAVLEPRMVHRTYLLNVFKSIQLVSNYGKSGTDTHKLKGETVSNVKRVKLSKNLLSSSIKR